MIVPTPAVLHPQWPRLEYEGIIVNGWRKDRLPEIVRSMVSRPRHEALRGLITELLREGFGAAFSELEHERYLVGNEC